MGGEEEDSKEQCEIFVGNLAFVTSEEAVN